MSPFQKVFLTLVVVAFSSLARAESTPDGREYFVDGMWSNTQAVQQNLMQSVTGYNYACGPTSLLFVSNFYARQSTGSNSPNMSSIQSSQRTLAELYAYLGKPANTTTSLDELKLIAKNRWLWSTAVRMSANNTVNQNMDNLISYLKMNTAALAVIRANYTGNPLYGSKIDHIVIITAYRREADEFDRPWSSPNNTRNNDTIEYYEPFYGRAGKIPRRHVTSSGSTSAFNITNFAFLAVGRW